MNKALVFTVVLLCAAVVESTTLLPKKLPNKKIANIKKPGFTNYIVLFANIIESTSFSNVAADTNLWSGVWVAAPPKVIPQGPNEKAIIPAVGLDVKEGSDSKANGTAGYNSTLGPLLLGFYQDPTEAILEVEYTDDYEVELYSTEIGEYIATTILIKPVFPTTANALSKFASPRHNTAARPPSAYPVESTIWYASNLLGDITLTSNSAYTALFAGKYEQAPAAAISPGRTLGFQIVTQNTGHYASALEYDTHYNGAAVQLFFEFYANPGFEFSEARHDGSLQLVFITGFVGSINVEHIMLVPPS